jgi:hypothetical protein
MGFVGAEGQSAVIKGPSQTRTTYQGGAGVKVKMSELVDVFANYDLEAASGYTGHNASMGIGFQF